VNEGKQDTMKKIGFVTPWYGANIPGGAETELRGLASHLFAAGTELEILTTCVQQFASDWNVNYYKPGRDIVDGIPVRRFPVRKRDTAVFDAVNAKLIKKLPVTEDEETVFMEEMVNSPDLYQYMLQNQDDYALFVYIPYMFGTTYYGVKQCPEKSVLIPCFHDEAYIHMDIFKEVFEQAAGVVYLSQPECELANRVFRFRNAEQAVLGAGVDTQFVSDADRFRRKYGISQPFILYAGRKDAGKNIDTLIKYFREYRNRHAESELLLVMIGGGEVTVPEDIRDAVRDLGFVDQQDKFDAYAAAEVMCQPSKNESFSIVIMESWLAGRPVLVHGGCAVTRDFVRRANAGLYFDNYFEFEGCIDYFRQHQETAGQMGQLGREFVLQNFAWDVIVKKYTDFFGKVIQK